MEYKELGSTGVKISKIGLGTWQFSQSAAWGESDISELEKVVDCAVDGGINLIDTAMGYGKSEEILGRLLKGKREKIFLATKLSTREFEYDKAKESLRQSLQRLNTDYIDLYQIHWPKIKHRCGQDMEKKDYQDIMDSLTKFKKEGLIRFGGVSNFRLHNLKEFSTEGLDFLVSNQVPYSLLWRFYDVEGVSEFCRSCGISFLAYSPFAQGLLTGRFQRGQAVEKIRRMNVLFISSLYDKAMEVVDVVKEIADEAGATPAQVSLRWLAEQDIVVSALAGARKVGHVQSNVEAMDLKLSSLQLQKLDKASMNFQKEMPEGLELWVGDNTEENLNKLGLSKK
jgi:myo-inositol catabolism protein IolS